MDYTTLKMIIAELGGEDHIIGLVFNNGARRMFQRGEFKKLDDFIFKKKDGTMVDTLLCIPENDIVGTPYKSIKPIATIECIVGVDDIKNADRIDLRYVGA